MRRVVQYFAGPAGHELAYQVAGTPGGHPVVFMPFWFTNLDVQWQDPALAAVLRRVGELGPLLLFDKVGLGLSRSSGTGDHPQTLDEQVADLAALMDHESFGPALVLAGGTSALVGIALAAARPDLVGELIVLGGTARLLEDDDYPIGLPAETVELAERWTHDTWGTGEALRVAHPANRDRELNDWYARFERASATPATASRQQAASMRMDVRDRLAEIRTPTLVIHRENDETIPASHGRFIADRIGNAQFRPLPGRTNLCFGESTREWFEPVRRFISDHATPWPGARAPSPRRFQAMVFSDIVDSTSTLFRAGDEEWRLMMHRYTNAITALLRTYEGRLQGDEGDGHLCLFDSVSEALGFACGLVERAANIGLVVRVGVHAGEIELTDDRVAGANLHIAARAQELAAPGEVLVTRTACEIVGGSSFEFEESGEHRFRGVPGAWVLYRLLM